MYRKDRVEYVIKTCSAEDGQELQNLLNEMSMNGWDLYSMHEVGDEESLQMNCIFMREVKGGSGNDSDIINISDFKSQMEKMLSPKVTEYEQCLDIQSKIRIQKEKINKIKKEIETEAPASISRKSLNDKISASLRELEELKVQLNNATSPDLMYSKLHEDKLTIALSEELLGFVDFDRANDNEDDLIAQTVKSRLKLTEELGYVIPKVVFKDDENLNTCEFTINVRGYESFKSVVFPNHIMYYADELKTEGKIKKSQEGIDEVTGRKVIWVEKDIAKDFWQKGMNACEYIAYALENVCVRCVDDLMDYDDIDKYLNIVEQENEFLVENIIPDVLNYADIKYLLSCLVKERVSIKNITYIFDKINDFANEGGRNDILDKIRISIARHICKDYVNPEDGTINAFEVKDISDFYINYDEGENDLVTVNGEYAEELAQSILKKSKKLGVKQPIIVVPLEYRHLLFSVLTLYINNIVVLAEEEIGCLFKVSIVGKI